MSVGSVKKFYEELAKNEDLKKEVFDAQEKFKDEDEKAIIEKVITEVAKKHGYDFTYQEFEEYKKTPKELDDDSLNAVTGGADVCACVVGGGGTYAEETPCVCVIAGGGNWGTFFVCICSVAGGGDDV